MGAKVLNPSSIKAKIGYALDSSGINRVVVGAPAANRITAKIKGVAAHAGLSPEKGISAIHLAARAIARLKLGRLDPESTANIGLIEGGTATNIIPESAVVHGEVRSHTLSKLKEHIQNIQDVFQDEVDNWTDPDELDYVVAGGGSDANIFNSFGIQCAILSTGMDKVHSTQETIKLSDMALTAELVMAILT
jgi:tripeptide aminopeptidase